GRLSDLDGLLRAVAAEALERAGDDDSQAGERARRLLPGTGTGMAGDLEPHASRTPALDDLDVPVDREPLADLVGDHGAHALDRGELVARGRADRVERPEPVGEGARGDRADVPDVEAHEDAPQVLRLRELELLGELRRVRRRLEERLARLDRRSLRGLGELA